MSTVIERARAKVNLTLHVGPPRADGYHPLESLVMFAGIGDVLTATATTDGAADFSLNIDGPFSKGLEVDAGNLILKAARAAQGKFSAAPCAFTLTKNLPIASGIGGGSADAAAALRAMARLAGLDAQAYAGAALPLGADVPVCMRSQTCVMRGIGESLEALPDVQTYSCVLVNPGVSVSTAAIFKRYDDGNPQDLVPRKYKGDLIALALESRNDLQPAACEVEPEIVRVLMELTMQGGARLVRMSGSGATCFAVFETSDQARDAAAHLSQKYPAWWVSASQLGGAI